MIRRSGPSRVLSRTSSRNAAVRVGIPASVRAAGPAPSEDGGEVADDAVGVPGGDEGPGEAGAALQEDAAHVAGVQGGEERGEV
ncbi:hypothetical protein GA0115246_107447, partial [Streptomyces sp. SolWspMP-sol7th]